MGAVNDLARREASAPDARRSWDEVEAQYREECATMLRDARRHYEQRAAREQTTIDNVLAAFARDFDAWLDRERRGISTPKPNLSTLFEIWLERGARRLEPPSPPSESSEADARSQELEQRLDEGARHIQELEQRLAEAQRRAAQRAAETAAALAAAPPAPRRRGRALLVTALVLFAAIIGAAQWARRSAATPPELRAALAHLDASASELEMRARAALGDLAASRAREEALAALLREDKTYVIAHAIAADPELARAKIDAVERFPIERNRSIDQNSLQRKNAREPSDPAGSDGSLAPSSPAPVARSPSEPPAKEPIAALPQNAPQAEVSEAAALTPEEEPERLPSAVIGLQKPAAFRGFDNRDLVGPTLATLRKLDQPACVAACRGRADCRAYSFDRWNRICRLKSAAVAFTLNPRMTSSLREDIRVPRAPSGALAMERYPSKAFPGAGYKTASVEGPEACEAACREEDACVAFTFRLDESACHLFTSTGEYFSNELADSGGKRQE
ncbi:PAN domain-containing protein [Methylosinus sp. LW3]|uniref:PAN domain-containing protein n=1 Tax=Methylosinus sp. LW3 TaxID=107635 RepID=UPI00046306E1|nr:PAN domain-containing protein [Methylosinus sp. LW3]